MAPTAVAWVAKNSDFQIAFDIERVAAEQPRRQVIPQQCDHRRTAGADRVGVAGADDAVAGVNAHHRRFLRGERLDRVGADRLWHKIDLQDFDAHDLGHGFSLFVGASATASMSPDAADIKTGKSRRFYPRRTADTSAIVGIDGAAPIRWTQTEAATFAYPKAL